MKTHRDGREKFGMINGYIHKGRNRIYENSELMKNYFVQIKMKVEKKQDTQCTYKRSTVAVKKR